MPPWAVNWHNSTVIIPKYLYPEVSCGTEKDTQETGTDTERQPNIYRMIKRELGSYSGWESVNTRPLITQPKVCVGLSDTIIHTNTQTSTEQESPLRHPRWVDRLVLGLLVERRLGDRPHAEARNISLNHNRTHKMCCFAVLIAK